MGLDKLFKLRGGMPVRALPWAVWGFALQVYAGVFWCVCSPNCEGYRPFRAFCPELPNPYNTTELSNMNLFTQIYYVSTYFNQSSQKHPKTMNGQFILDGFVSTEIISFLA